MMKANLDALPKGTRGKLDELRTVFEGMGRALVAFSGGLDSGFLLKFGHDAIGDRVLGVIGVSPSVPRRELEEAQAFAERYGIPYRTIDTSELEDPRYRANPENRCFYCKTELFGKLKAIADREKIPYILDGTNESDRGDHRPGREAARNTGVRSPLAEVGLTKDEIRQAARALGLEIWNKPSFACLGSRFPYGTEITAETLSRVEGCEDLLRDIGLAQFRVRHHDRVARIEVDPRDFPTILEHRDDILRVFRKNGYRYVTLDLQGYRTGSMNEALKDEGDPKTAKPGAEKKDRRPKWMDEWKPKTFGAGWATIYIDGACRRNPGPAAIAWVIYDDAGKELARHAEAIGEATNNVAEYRALESALAAALERKRTHVAVLSDSELVVKQIRGEYRIKNANMLRMAARVQELRRRFRDFRIQAVPREENRLADHLASSKLKPARKPVRKKPARSEE